MASLEQIQIQALQNDLSNIKEEISGATRAYNQLSLTLHQKLESNDKAIQEVLSEVHHDYVVLANALDAFMRYMMSTNLELDEQQGLIDDINKFLNRGPNGGT